MVRSWSVYVGRLVAVATLAAGVVAFGAIGLVPASANVTTGAISGTVTNDDASPADGCLGLYTAVTGDWAGLACTDAGGAFAYSDLAPGDYKLYFYAFPFAVSEWMGHVGDWSSATVTTVTGGANTIADFQLVRAARISGTVTDASAAPAIDGCVAAVAAGGVEIASSCVNGMGQYVIDHLPASASYHLRFYAFTGAGSEWYSHAHSIGTSGTVAVGAAGTTTTVDYQLPNSGPLVGTVYLDTGAPASSGDVRGYDGDGYFVEEAAIGADGSYSFESLSRSQIYRFYLQAAGQGQTAQYFDAAPDWPAATGVNIAATGATTQDMHFAAPATLSGQVLNYDGTPATGGCVVAYSEPSGYFDGVSCVDGTGHYSISGLLDRGRYTFELTGFDGGTASEYYDGQADWATADTYIIGTTSDTLELVIGGSAAFPDVPVGAAFRADIEWMADQGITTGYGDGTFRPVANVSRQAMAAFMYRFAGSPVFTPPVASPFNDVPTDSTFYKEVCWMADQGISMGYGDGGFHPVANVSRQAMAAFMYRFAGSPVFAPPGTSPFNDVPTSSTFYAEIAWMAANGISTGYGDGGFHPSANVSRQAMAAFMHRLDGVLNPV